MNKKAIAAFAAGATLLAGFAMATPAMANEAKFNGLGEIGDFFKNNGFFGEAKKTYTEKDRTQAKLDYLTAVDEQAAAAKKANAEQTKYEAAVAEAKQAQAKYDDGLAAAKAAGIVKANGQLDATEAAKPGKAAAVAAAKTAGVLNEAGNAVLTRPADAPNAALQAARLDLDAKDTLLDAAKKHYEEVMGSSATPTTPDPKQPEEVTPSTKAGFIGLVSSDKVALDEATANKADKMKTYSEKYNALSAADAALSAATANFKAAHQRVVDAKAAGEDVSNPTAYNDLVDAEKRAQAELDAAQADFNKANAEFNKAKREAEKASAVYNAALKKYKKDYNAAIAAGVKLPADLPQITDPLAPTTLPGVPGVPVPGQPGKPGKPGKPEVEKKKNDGKKLPKTGVGVTLTALAATMLAGMGAAVRKARH